MAHAERLIVGLGNPGAKYAETRHNIGFRVVQALADALSTDLEKSRFEALVGWADHRGETIGLALPLTYVNRSGQAVQPLLQQHDVQPHDLLVVVDDVNLSVGQLRLRPRGGSGGHNGLQDIADRLGTTDFPRLRIGIGDDYPKGGQADYVLSPFDSEEEPIIERAVEEAVQASLTFVHDGVDTAMNRYN